MLTIVIPAKEQWDETNQRFIYSKETVLQLEHSLISLSKWETKWWTPFLTKKEKTFEETISYIECMTINKNIDPTVYNCLTVDNIKEIHNYIYSPMTATKVPTDKKASGNKDVLTSELLYYWMIQLNIPFECEKWHLNRLIALIDICNFKNQPAKKMSQREIMSRNSALNAERRKKLNTKG